jgi:hypothetical protein
MTTAFFHVSGDRTPSVQRANPRRGRLRGTSGLFLKLFAEEANSYDEHGGNNQEGERASSNMVDMGKQ